MTVPVLDLVQKLNHVEIHVKIVEPLDLEIVLVHLVILQTAVKQVCTYFVLNNLCSVALISPSQNRHKKILCNGYTTKSVDY